MHGRLNDNLLCQIGAGWRAKRFLHNTTLMKPLGDTFCGGPQLNTAFIWRRRNINRFGNVNLRKKISHHVFYESLPLDECRIGNAIYILIHAPCAKLSGQAILEMYLSYFKLNSKKERVIKTTGKSALK